MPSRLDLEERQLLQRQGYAWRVVKWPARMRWYKPDGATFESLSEQANRLSYLRKGYRLTPFPAGEVVQPVQQAMGATATYSDVSEPTPEGHRHTYNKTGHRCLGCGKMRERGYKKARKVQE